MIHMMYSLPKTISSRKREKGKGCHMTEILSAASNFDSPLQIIALIIVLSFLSIIAIMSYFAIKQVCRVVSSFNRVNLSGEHNDTRFKARLRR